MHLWNPFMLSRPIQFHSIQHYLQYLFSLWRTCSGHRGHLGGLEVPTVAVPGLFPMYCLNMVLQLCFRLKLHIAAGASRLGSRWWRCGRRWRWWRDGFAFPISGTETIPLDPCGGSCCWSGGSTLLLLPPSIHCWAGALGASYCDTRSTKPIRQSIDI